jgi:predicted amidophosphoribosyltransferase
LKICPLCKTKFDDEVGFCPKCHAQLNDLKEVEKAEKQPVPKSFWWSLAGVFGFIIFMVFLYNFFFSEFFN